MTAQQIQRIYSLGTKIGIAGNNRNDNLHALIESLTGKDSVKALNNEEYEIVVKELVKRAGIADNTQGKSRKSRQIQASGGITVGQQKKVWYLMYQLVGCDKQPSAVSIGERLCGIIKRELNIDALPKNPFIWVDYQDGSVLIERLKKYVSSAELKAMRGD